MGRFETLSQEVLEALAITPEEKVVFTEEGLEGLRARFREAIASPEEFPVAEEQVKRAIAALYMEKETTEIALDQIWTLIAEVMGEAKKRVDAELNEGVTGAEGVSKRPVAQEPTPEGSVRAKLVIPTAVLTRG